MHASKIIWIVTAITVSLLAGSALAASAGAEAEGGWTTGMLVWRVVNTVVLLGVLVHFMRKPLVKFFSERKAQIEIDLEEAEAERKRAESTIKEYERKIGEMEQELERMRAELRKAAEIESEKVVGNAERMAKAMMEAARVAADQEVRKARAALQSEAGKLAVEMAEGLIREKIGDNDQKRIFQDYLARVEGMK